ncbi:hypothetical protein [Rhodococcus qingshengii]|uniref:hypothetical protein n=1 Tax=Rhodococcus qingshengii TaxID=334542 RepID=UPI002943304C|nr:hypothetical protein [Rhodococcus qingshengii]WOI86002.1 hypothetical protein R0122_22750 [Rhodococcus qingshengii]
MSKKITDLPTLSSADNDDLIPIVDISGNVTKKVTASGLAAAVVEGIPDGSITSSKMDLTTFAAFAVFMPTDWSPSSTGNMNIYTSSCTKVYSLTNSVNSSGVFTAPVNGVYHFDFFMRNTVAQNIIVGFLHSAIGAIYGQQQATGANTGRVNASIDIEMFAGETLTSNVVTSTGGGFIGGRSSNQFNGHFVRPLPAGYVRP